MFKIKKQTKTRALDILGYSTNYQQALALVNEVEEEHQELMFSSKTYQNEFNKTMRRTE